MIQVIGKKLFKRFTRFNSRKINPAFTVTAAAFFGKQIFVHHAANVKNRSTE